MIKGGLSILHGQAIKFMYTNYKGERAERHVMPNGLEYGEFPYHEGPQWFLHGQCLDRKARRTFALKDIEGETLERYYD